MTRRVPILLPILLLALALAARPAAAGLPLRLEGTFEGDRGLRRDVRAVCTDVLALYERRVAARPARGVKPLVLRTAPDGCPRACLDRLPHAYLVHLTCLETRHYCQIMYQLGHELGHVWADPRRSGGWFAESVMEAMALATLAHMETKWRTDPPYPNWKPYADEIRRYRLAQVKRSLERVGLEHPGHVADWVRDELPARLARGETGRPTQHVAAVLIYGCMNRHPKAWSALVSLGAANPKGVTDFDAWEAKATERAQPLVAALANHFRTAVAALPPEKPDEEEGQAGESDPDDAEAPPSG